MDFCNYFEGLKYKETMNNVDGYFQQVKIVNFDIIHHQCKNDPLEKQNDPVDPLEEHFSVKRSDFSCPECERVTKKPSSLAPYATKTKEYKKSTLKKNLSKSIFSSKNSPCK